MGQFNERKYAIFKYLMDNGGTVEYSKLKNTFPNQFRSIYVYRKWKYLKIHHIGKSKKRYITLYEKGKRTFRKMDFLNREGCSLNIRKELL